MKGLVILCVDDKDIVLKISKQESEHTLRSNKSPFAYFLRYYRL
jgi:hypothetical protein